MNRIWTEHSVKLVYTLLLSINGLLNGILHLVYCPVTWPLWFFILIMITFLWWLIFHHIRFLYLKTFYKRSKKTRNMSNVGSILFVSWITEINVFFFVPITYWNTFTLKDQRQILFNNRGTTLDYIHVERFTFIINYLERKDCWSKIREKL